MARKEIIAGRALRLPTIPWVFETLQKDDNISGELFLEEDTAVKS